MSLKRFYSEFDSAEIYERMAFDLLKDSDYIDSIQNGSMSNEQADSELLKLFGVS